MLICAFFAYIENSLAYKAAFTYYDPAILQNKLTSLSIFGDLALRKGDSKKSLCFNSMCSIECILTFQNCLGL